MTRDYRNKSVLVICHGGVVLIFRRLLERWNEDEYLKIDREQDVLNCSMTAGAGVMHRGVGTGKVNVLSAGDVGL